MALCCGTCGLVISPYGNNYEDRYGSKYYHNTSLLYTTCAYANKEIHNTAWFSEEVPFVADPEPNKLATKNLNEFKGLTGYYLKPKPTTLEPVYVPAKSEPITVALVFQTKGRKFKSSS